MAAAEQPDSEKPKQEEWIHVKSKSRFRRNAPKPPAQLPGSASKPDEPRILKSVADITTEYESFKARWRDTACHSKLRELVKTNAGKHQTVRKAVCLGVGTFDPEDGGWDAKRRSYIQLDGFLTIVEVLSHPMLAELYKESIQCSFQEPRFAPNDTEFLTNLGHKVVESPAAFEAVDEDTLVFAVHMYRPIYEATLEKALPAMFVGTGWDVWDEFATMKEGDFKCMSDMHASHEHFPFPQDGTYTTFSSTCLYWRSMTEPPTSPEDQPAEESSTLASEKHAENSSEEAAEAVSEDKPEPTSQQAPS
ncbi:sensitivity to red light reduced- srr1 [Colletotrichum tofieldiae]|nr:sensitivity to red light reduced- srr1 [Colletotrichum tofieldiae]